MKKQLSLVKFSLFVIAILTIVESYFLFLKPDLPRIIFFSITILGLLTVIFFYVVCLLEVRKIIFEMEKDNYLIRLVEYDDYQLVRVLLDQSELSNSEEEIKTLEEYQKITVDLVRIDHHYLVFKDNSLVSIFHAHVKKTIVDITFKNESAEQEKIKELLKQKVSSYNKEINFLN